MDELLRSETMKYGQWWREVVKLRSRLIKQPSVHNDNLVL